MTEIAVHQRSPEWFELRKSVFLTASNFGDAIGVGVGKAFDFLQSRIYNSMNDSFETSHMRHGLDQEPIIAEAYQLLTGNRTEPSGFWLPPETSPLHCMVGASPDSKVLGPAGDWIGLAEFKAPVYCMYSTRTHGSNGIPRSHMAQMQGQMAICQKPWCDFMAVCTKTEDIMLKRVYFQPSYWSALSSLLHEFCSILKEARQRHEKGVNPFNFAAAQTLRSQGSGVALLPGEGLIPVEDLLEKRENGEVRAGSVRGWMSYQFLMGSPCILETDLNAYGNRLLREVDTRISGQLP